MSPTLSDDLLVRDLHERADRLLPAMSLEPVAVLLASHHHRRRQTAVRSAAGVLAVGAFVVGAVQIWADETPTPMPPAGVDQSPRPIGDGQTVELAPGVFAANRPVEMTLGDGTPVLDLGIMTSGPTQVPATTPNEEQSLVVSPISGEELAIANFPDMAPPLYDSGVYFTHLWESGLGPVGSGVPWSTQEATFDYAGQGYLPSPPGWTMSGSDGPALYVGAVPAAIPDPRVVLFSERGFRLADGTTTHSLEVPTYSAPTDDARLLWTVQVTEEQGFTGGELDPPVSVSLFIGSDGSVTTGLWCGGTTLQLCAEGIGPELYAAAGLAPAEQPQRPVFDPGLLPDGVVEVAPGIRAAAEPTERGLGDGTTALVLGLLAGDDADARELAIVPNDGTNGTDPYGFGQVWASRDATLDLAFLAGTDVAQRQYWETWGTSAPLTAAEAAFWGLGADGAVPMGLEQPLAMAAPGPDLLPADEGFAIAMLFDDHTYLIIGFAPADADPDLLAEVTLREPVAGSDGDPTKVLRLPTFAAPTADGRRMFAATIDPSVGLPTTGLGTYPLERIPVPLVDAR